MPFLSLKYQNENDASSEIKTVACYNNSIADINSYLNYAKFKSEK